MITMIFLVPSTTIATNAAAGLESSEAAYVSELGERDISYPADIFDVRVDVGTEYDGYIFQLVDNAIIPFVDNDNIQALVAQYGLFRANTIQDIIDFTEPEYILYIEPDYMIFLDPIDFDFIDYDEAPLSFAPFAFQSLNDPLYSEQWGLEFIRGAAAWSTAPAPIAPSPRGVVVAVIDSGIYRDHVDFESQNILPGRNFVGLLGCTGGECSHTCDGINHVAPLDMFDTSDDHGHGTAVTSVIAATRNNGIGIASMACGVTILPLRVLYGDNLNRPLRTSALASAIHYAVDAGADVINISLSWPWYRRSETVTGAIERAAAANILIIAAVGNQGQAPLRFPVGLPHVIGVGSVDRHGNRAHSSNYNASVFVTAPGVGINVLLPNNEFDTRNGTSFAAPKIAALAAIARGHNPNITGTEFRRLLIRSSINTAPGRNDYLGHGIIDVGLFMYNLTRNDFFSFIDVPQNHWARVRIYESARYGLMHGRVLNYTPGGNLGSHRLYSPNAPMWRLEMTMAIGRLHQLNGGNIPWQASSFNDVNDGYFPYNYARFVNWAQDNNIVAGVGGNRFNPGGVVTREQAAVFFYRYTHFLAQTRPDIRAELDRVLAPPFNHRAILRQRFPNDYRDVSAWAERQLAWAITVGLVSGRGTPQGPRLYAREPLTRGEGASLLSRYRRQYMITTFATTRTGWDHDLHPHGFEQLSFRLGGTDSYPTYPSYIEPTTVLIADCLNDFLLWYRGGILYNGPERHGYQFIGWYMDSNFTMPLTEEAKMPSTAITLYARWDYMNPGPVYVGHLQAAIAAAESRQQLYYTPESWAYLQAQLATARAIYADFSTTQPQVNTATRELWVAIEALEPDGYLNQPPVDTWYLEQTIAEAESRQQQNYTQDSWANLQAILATARAVLEAEPLTQTQINTATNNLQAALQSLETATNQPTPIHTGRVSTTPWNLYADGTLHVQGGTVNWNAGTSPWLSHSADIRNIVFSAPIDAGPQLRNLFRGLENLETVSGLENINTTNVTNMTAMFFGATNLTSIYGLANWDTSNVTRMDFMFRDARSLAHGVDISGWDVGRVVTMERMFINANALPSLDLSNWNTQSVTDMDQMFRGATSLVTVGDLSGWNTANVRYMSSMFRYTHALQSLDLSGWNTVSVVDMSDMFMESGVQTIGVFVKRNFLGQEKAP